MYDLKRNKNENSEQGSQPEKIPKIETSAAYAPGPIHNLWTHPYMYMNPYSFGVPPQYPTVFQNYPHGMPTATITSSMDSENSSIQPGCNAPAIQPAQNSPNMFPCLEVHSAMACTSSCPSLSTTAPTFTTPPLPTTENRRPPPPPPGSPPRFARK